MALHWGDNLLWKCCLVLSCLLTFLARKTVDGGCGDNDSRGRSRHEEDKCWYELWYFWFIVVLVFITIVILVIFYCKHQVKRSTGHRARHRTPVLTVPVAPPNYEVPGHDPPPYHVAMASSAVLAVPEVPVSASTLTRVNLQHASSSAHASLPGYVMDASEYQAYDNLSMASTMSLGTVSSPPPYSPPPPTSAFYPHNLPDQANVSL